MRKLALALCLALASPALAAVSGTSSYQDYTGNGATVAFAFTFPATSSSWVKTYVGGAAAGGVTVALNANQTTSPGGTVTFLAAPADRAAVRIQREVPLTQELILQPGSPFPSKTIEKTFDRLVMQSQQEVRDRQAQRDADVAAQDTRDDGQDATIATKRNTADQAAKDAAQDASLFAETSARSSEDASIRAQVASAAMGGGVNIADASTVLATGSTTALPLSAWMAQAVSAKAFGGAKGDGVTDDGPALSIAGARPAFYLPPGTYRIATNTTLPATTRLVVPRGTTILIASGVTLTVDAQIDAGYYPIFAFADATAQVTASDPGLWDSAASPSPVLPHAVKVDWFGAVPDGVPPYLHSTNPNALPTGTDSSDGFRRALRYAHAASLKGSYPYSYSPYVTVEFAPGGVYRVRGDNLLGPQNTALGGAWLRYEGHGAQLLHEVTAADDTLIRNAAYLFRPVFHDFGVDVFGTVARQGNFLSTNSPVGYVDMASPEFSGLRVNVYGAPRGYSHIFHIDGTTMADTGIVRGCQFYAFSTFWYSSNPEAVNWLFDKNHIAATTDSSVIFDVQSNFSGSLVAQNNEMVLSNAAPLLLRTGSSATAAPHGKFAFLNNRCEERQESDTAHFDVSFGITELDGTNFLAGAAAGGGGRTANKRIAIIRGNALVRLKNCAFQTNQVTIQTNELGASGRTDGLYVENCTFQNESKAGYATGAGLKFTFLDAGGAASSMKSALAAGGWKNVESNAGAYGAAGRAVMPYDIAAMSAHRRVVSLSTLRAADGKGTANIFAELPSWIVVTSVKLYAAAFSVASINGITLYTSNAAGGISNPSATALTGAAVSGQELLLAGKHITITDADYALLAAGFTLGGSFNFVSNVDLMPESYLEITYEGVSRPYQVPSPITSPYYVHDKI